MTGSQSEAPDSPAVGLLGVLAENSANFFMGTDISPLIRSLPVTSPQSEASD